MGSIRHEDVIPFTRAGILLPFLTFLDGQGVPSEKYLRKTKISRDLLENPEAPIPLSLVHRFFRESTGAEGIECIGLDVGRMTTARDLGRFGALLLGARNVFEYLKTGIRFIGTVTSGDRYWLEREGDNWVRFCFHHKAPGIAEIDKQQAYLFTLVVTVGTLREIAGADWCPRTVSLPVLSSRSRIGLSEFLPGTDILTGTNAASFLLPRSLLAKPFFPAHLSTREPTPFGMTTLPTELPATVALLIESLIPDGGNPGIATAAEAAGMSVRTLRRRLADCGTSYSDLVARTRMTLAEKWLAQQERSITEIALSLGYADRSNFTRAFRRVNGLSPTEYQKSLGRDSPPLYYGS